MTPFGLINDHRTKVNVILDEAMMREDYLNCYPCAMTPRPPLPSDALFFVRSCGHEPQMRQRLRPRCVVLNFGRIRAI